jgi:CelD/BcsL family acetyltransferase involved in cellulose biosynthesis
MMPEAQRQAIEKRACASVPAADGFLVRQATAEQFQQARPDWNRLVAGMRFPAPFCTWEWIYTWWKQFGRAYEPVPLFIYRAEELCGILPLFRRRAAQHSRWWGGATLIYGGTTEVYPDHLDVICAAADAPGCARAALDFLDTAMYGWARVRLPMLAQDSDLLRALSGSRAGPRVAIQQVSAAPYIALPGSFEDYLGGLRSKERYNIRSRRKKLLEDGKVRYQVVGPSEFEPALQALFALHARRADAKGITSTFGGSAIFEFHRALLQCLDPRDVMLRCLRDEAGVIAALYGFRCGGRIFFYQIGYAPEWSWAHPGVVLISEAIREACETGCTEYNFLQGEEPYKRAFTHQARALFDGCLFSSTFPGRLAHGAHGLRERVKAAIRRQVPARRSPS